MSKIRVHQLAKELGIEPKEFITRLDKMGIRGKKAQSSLDSPEETRIRSTLMVAKKLQ